MKCRTKYLEKKKERVSCHSNLIVTILSDVANPRQSLITTFFLNLKVSYLDATDCEVGNFELKLDRHSWILLSLLCFDTWETELCSHHVFFAPWELLDAPDHGVLIRHILHSAHIRFKDRRVNICRDWDRYFNVVSNWFRLELSFGFHEVFNLRPGKIFNCDFNPYKRFDLGVQSVSHQIEFTIRRDESNVSFILELVKSYTLMELDIFHFN